MSVRYQIAKRLVRLTGMKKLIQLPQDEPLKKAEQMNRKRQLHMPKDTKARYADRDGWYFRPPAPARRTKRWKELRA